MSDADRLYRFLFEHTAIRGNLVYLDATWRAIRDAHPYPAAVRALLGEALAAVPLLAATIKLEGALILQVQGTGPIRTLVVQTTHDQKVRGLARWSGEVASAGTLPDLFGTGHLALTIERRDGRPYQGIVPLEEDRLAGAIERYFRDSEQLPTRLWLAADEERVAGLLLQRLPSPERDDEDWRRIGMLAETLTPAELTGQSSTNLLYRLFNEERVRLFEPEPVAFRCGCSRGRIATTLKMLGAAEVESIIAEQGAVEVTCEFCNRLYRFDAVDIGQLFAADTRHAPPPGQH